MTLRSTIADAFEASGLSERELARLQVLTPGQSIGSSQRMGSS